MLYTIRIEVDIVRESEDDTDAENLAHQIVGDLYDLVSGQYRSAGLDDEDIITLIELSEWEQQR